MNENLDKKYENVLNILGSGMNEFKTSKEQLEEASNMKLYCINKGLNILCFDTMEKLEDYSRLNDLLSNVRFTIEYIGDFKGKNDVIKETLGNTIIYFSKSEEEEKYDVYCKGLSQKSDSSVWQAVCGSIDDMYMEFKNRGIEFASNLETPKVKKHII